MRKHFKTLALVCCVFGLVAIVSAFKKPLPPPGPERQGAITAIVLVSGVFFIVAAVLYWKRER
jgi:hypothetical protein